MARINLGKVVPEKGVDYFTAEEIAQIKSEVESDLDTRITNDETQITANKNDITDINTALTSLTGRVSTNETNIAANAGDIDTLEGKVATLESDMETAKSNIQENAGDIDTIEQQQTIQDNAIAANTAALEPLANVPSRVTALETSQTAQDAKILELEEENEALRHDLNVSTLDSTDTPSDNVILENTVNARFKKLIPEGDTEQFTTTGKNKINVENPDQTSGGTATSVSYDKINDILTVSSTSTGATPYATYVIDENLVEGDVIRLNTIIKDTNGQVRTSVYNGTSWASSISASYSDGTSVSSIVYTVPSGITGIRFYIYSNNVLPTGNTSSRYEKLIVTKNNDNMTFEKYTGGKASPNPNYPQKIKNVDGSKNNFNIADFINNEPTRTTMSTINDKLNLKAISTVGAQLVTNYVKNVDNTKTYTLSCKAKKVVKGTDGNPGLRIYCYGSNDDITYSSRIAESELTGSDTVEGQTYALAFNVTGYKYYKFYFYNNGNTPVTIGEETEYWNIQFEEGSLSTGYVPYKSIGNKVQNNNLFDINGDVNTRYNGSIFADNTVSGNDLTTVTNGGSAHPYGQKIYVGAGNTVVLSAVLKSLVYDTTPDSTVTVAYLSLYNYGTLDNRVGRGIKYSEVGTKISATLTASTDYILVGFSRGGSASTVTSATFTDIQLEIGNSATDYIPHAEQTKYFTLEDGQYLAEGDYLADDGIHKVKGQIVLDGSQDESWGLSNTGTSNFFYRYNYINDRKLIQSGVGIDYCNEFSYAEIGNSTTNEGFYIVGNNNQLRIRFGTEMTLENFKTWLSNNPITVQYPLAEEAVIPYTQTQQTQWKEIKKAMSYYGQTHVSGIGNLNPIINAVAIKDINTMFENLDSRIALLED